MKFRRKGPLPQSAVFLLSFILFAIATVKGMFIIDKGIEPYIMSYAKTKAEQIALEAVHDAVARKVADELDIRELIVLHNVEGTNNVSYSFDPKQYNTVLAEATHLVQAHLRLLEEGRLEELQHLKELDDYDYLKNREDRKEQGVVTWVPLGIATRTAILSNLGPRIPVRLEMIGNVAAEIRTEVERVAINNAYIEFFIDLRVKVNVIIPSRTDDIVIKKSIKLGDLFIPGEVPNFYNGSGSGNTLVPVIPNSDVR